MKRMMIYTGILILSTLVISCGGNKNKLDTLVDEFNIQNPNTANGEVDMDALPVFSIDNLEYNFGTLIQGEKVSHGFVFKNTGKSNLVISSVKASCGCTTPKWTKEPIKPGQKGTIDVVFDSAGRSGEQSKTIKVYTNAQPNMIEMRIRCEIVTN